MLLGGLEIVALVSLGMSVVGGITSCNTYLTVRQMRTAQREDNAGVDIVEEHTDEIKKNGSVLHTSKKTIRLDQKNFAHDSDHSSGTRTGLENKTAQALAEGSTSLLRYAISPAASNPAQLNSPQVSEAGDQPTSLLTNRYDEASQGIPLYVGDSYGKLSPVIGNRPTISTSNKSSPISSPNASPYSSPQASPNAASGGSNSSSPYGSKKDLNIGFNKKEAPNFFR